ncbi:MAG TPA: BMP family ABC transporter substrate-binding protein [Gaiellaceae bacterium]|nr:BMP family ABC transporter substrate-binding protein [Gaiellaceae bacterium]
MKGRIGIAAALVVALAAAAAGCGGSGGGTTEQSAGGTTGSSAAKPLVVLVTDIGQLNDHGFNQLAYEGLKRAQRELGIDGRVYQSASSQDYIPNLARAAQQGAVLVVSVGFDQANAIATAAKKFPHTNFAIIDVDQRDLKGNPQNVEGIVFSEQEVGYLAGYLAGLMEKGRGGAARIGSVGGEKQPPVDRYIAGYQAGARKADPGIGLLNAYSQDWVDQTKCKVDALNQIQGGANIVFQVAGGCGLGVIDAAKQKQVWAIGVDADQSYLGPQVLTSAMKRVDNSVYDTVKQVLDGTFAGGTNSRFSLANDGVGLGKISPKVPKAYVEKVDAIRKQIVAGKIADIPTTVK